jgi:hypothetical protein
LARIIGSNVTVLNLAGDVLATFESASLEQSRNLVDVTACKDTYKQWVDGLPDWTVTCTKIVSTSRVWPSQVASGGTVTVSITEGTGGKVYSGVGRIERVSSDLGGVDAKQTETITIHGDGELTVT